MTQTVSDAVARKDSNSPTALIKQYSADFASVLPSHIKADTWVRLAQGALKKGKRIDDKKDPNVGQFELDVAARNNPGVFLATLLDAARLGLEPGTEQYYLTPRKVKGRLEILGIVGYQGHIELMYRAGAVSSIVAEVVREADEYDFVPGQIDREVPPRWLGPQEVPYHRYPSFAGETSRGALRGVYALARMKDGAVSRVVQLGRDDIARIKASSQGANGEYSPWKLHEAAMWLKSAVRQLQKWVPTSAEYRREIMRASAEAQRAAEAAPIAVPDPTSVGDTIDGEIIGADSEWPPPADIPGGDE